MKDQRRYDVKKSDIEVYNNFHAHSHYSLGDSTSHVDEYVKACKANGATAVCLTEHGTLASAYELWDECRKEEIKPILGIEAYCVDDYKEEAAQIPYNYYHLTLICMNEVGWNNLKKLNTISWQDGYLRKPRMSLGSLRKHSEGLICLSGCVGGPVGKMLLGADKFHNDLILKERKKLALKRFKKLKKIFGNRFFFEIMLLDLDVQIKLNKYLLKLYEKYGNGNIVITCDTHYVKKKDWQIHDVLICRTYRKKLDDPENGTYSTKILCVKNSKDIYKMWKKWHKYIPKILIDIGIKNTEKIANKIEQYPIVPQKNTLPKYGKGDSMETLIKLCKKGYKRRLTEKQRKSKKYKARLKLELSVIKKIGYPDYFLLVWNIVRQCRKQGIAVGPGRGSVCGSLVAFLLDITQIDPLRFDLLFERFLNEDRISMPDIDMDFSRSRRDDVMKMMVKMYGEEKLSQIGNYGKWKPRGLIKDVGRVMGYEFNDLNKITSHIGDKVDKWKEIPREVKEFLRENKKLGNRAKRLMGTINYRGIHASGIIITPTDITEWVPIAYTKSAGKNPTKQDKITEWDMYALEDLNILKFDRLGLTNLDIIQETVKLVSENYGKNTIDNIDKICLDDLENPNIFKMMRNQELQGLFQIEKSQGMARLLADIKPKCFHDIVLLISLFRTAVLQAGMHTEYVKRRRLAERGLQKQIKIIHPMLKGVLGSTYGVLIFQEQVMAIGHVMGNMTLREADNFRKAIKSKDSEKFKVWQEKFLKGAKENGVKSKIAKKVWDWMYKFSGYGFNVSHAVAYAFITYQTAWLKFYYRKEFMASVMSECQKGDDAKIKLPKCIQESKKHFKIESPHINHSTDRFTIYKDDLLFPLSAIKTIGEKAVESILDVQKDGKIKDFEDFHERVNKRTVNVGIMSNLIMADVFRDFGNKEEIFDGFMEMRGKDKVARQLFCYDCKYRYPEAIKEGSSAKCPSCGSGSTTTDIEYCSGKKFNHTFIENNYVYGFNVKENALKKHIRNMIKYKYKEFDEAVDLPIGETVKIMATVVEIKKHIDRKENEMAFIKLKDINFDEADLCIFSSDWVTLKNIIKKDGNYKMRLVKNPPSPYNTQKEMNNFIFKKYDKCFVKKIK